MPDASRMTSNIEDSTSVDFTKVIDDKALGDSFQRQVINMTKAVNFEDGDKKMPVTKKLSQGIPVNTPKHPTKSMLKRQLLYEPSSFKLC